MNNKKYALLVIFITSYTQLFSTKNISSIYHLRTADGYECRQCGHLPFKSRQGAISHFKRVHHPHRVKKSSKSSVPNAIHSYPFFDGSQEELEQFLCIPVTQQPSIIDPNLLLTVEVPTQPTHPAIIGIMTTQNHLGK